MGNPIVWFLAFNDLFSEFFDLSVEFIGENFYFLSEFGFNHEG